MTLFPQHHGDPHSIPPKPPPSRQWDEWRVAYGPRPGQSMADWERELKVGAEQQRREQREMWDAVKAWVLVVGWSAAVLVGLLGTYGGGYADATADLQRDAIARGFAEYNGKTGEWQWKYLTLADGTTVGEKRLPDPYPKFPPPPERPRTGDEQ